MCDELEDWLKPLGFGANPRRAKIMNIQCLATACIHNDAGTCGEPSQVKISVSWQCDGWKIRDDADPGPAGIECEVPSAPEELSEDG